MPSSSFTTVSKCMVYPSQKSTLDPLKLSVSDIPMLSCQYIQKGVLLSESPYSIDQLLLILKNSLSETLSQFPPLAGRLRTDDHGHIHILCNDAGIEFIHVKAKYVTIHKVLSPLDVPDFVKKFFTYDRTISYNGHWKPLAAVQLTELADGLFVGCTVNHAVTDGTSLWHFFNSFAEICRGVNKKTISNSPDFSRDTVFDSPAVLRFPPGGPSVTFSEDEPLRERILHFSREAILKLKSRANNTNLVRIAGKPTHNGWEATKRTTEISSFQSLCAQLWRSVTRARKLSPAKTTTFRMAVNCRHRLEPKMKSFYFGNAIQSIPTFASAGDVLSNDLGWCAGLLHKNVVAHDDATVRRGILEWEMDPRLYPLGNADGASITMGSSPRFPMYNNDFGWGKPLAIRSGMANKFDGKISAFPGRDGNGSVDLEVVLAPSTMAGLERDMEIMQYVSSC